MASRRSSSAERTSFNARLNSPGEGGDGGSLVFNHLDAPDAQDPLGLTRAQFLDDPGQTASQALSQSLYEAEKLETGVDTDRELQNLLIIEQAYAANARVLETIDQMIQRLMEI